MRNKIILTVLAFLLLSGGTAYAQIDVDQGGTGFSVYVAGDILYATSTDEFFNLAIGSNGQCLTVSSGVPAWGSCATGVGDPILIDGVAVTDGLGVDLIGGTNLTISFNAGASPDTATFNVGDAFIVNDASDIMIGTFTADGLTLGVNENITLGSFTLDHDAITFVFNDSIKLGGASSTIYILEQAEADPDVAGYGQLWVDIATPNELFFTDDAGNDMQLGLGDISAVFDCARGDCNQITVETGEELFVAPGGEIHATETIISVNNDSGATLYACTAVYISAFDIPSDLPEVAIADADDSSKMQSIGLVENDIVDGADGIIVIHGAEGDWDTVTGEGWSVGDDLYINDSGTSADDDCGNTLTNVRPPNIDDNVQKIGQVLRVHGTQGQIAISGAGRVNDVPNLDSAKFWVGNGSNVATIVSMSGEATMSNTGAVTLADSVAVSNWTLTTPLISGILDMDAGSVNDDDCTGQIGIMWFDDTDNAFEFCNADSGVPSVLGEGGVAASTTLDVIEDLKADSTIEFKSFNWTIDTAAASSTFAIDGGTGIISIGGDIIPSTSNAKDLGGSGAIMAQVWAFHHVMGDDIGTRISSGGTDKIQIIIDSGAKVTIQKINPTVEFATLSITGGVHTNFFPRVDSDITFGTASRFWDETFIDELILSNAGTAATAANTVRLGGLDFVAGDAGLLITTEDDTDYLFASDVMFGATATSTAPFWWDLSASSTEIANLGRISFNDGDITLTHTANTLTLAGGTLSIVDLLISGDTIDDFANQAGLADGDSANIDSDTGLEIVSNSLTLLRGCNDNQILKWDETNDDWNCEIDATGAGGSAIVFDIGDDGGNDSIDVVEIATTGDTNAIFSEPSDDKILIAVGNNWPTADSAELLTISSFTLDHDATTFVFNDSIKLSGASSTVYILEQAEADPDFDGYGQIWVNLATPSELWFTSDTGVDTQLGVGGAVASTTLDVIEDLNASSTIEFASSTWTIDTAAASSTFVIDGDLGLVTLNDLALTGNVTTSLIPDTANTHNLGSDALPFAELFIGEIAGFVTKISSAQISSEDSGLGLVANATGAGNLIFFSFENLDASTIFMQLIDPDSGNNYLDITGDIQISGNWRGALTFIGTGTINGLDGLDATSQTTINNIIDGDYLTNGNVDAKVVEKTGNLTFANGGIVASSTQFLPIINAITIQEIGCFSSENASGTIAVEWRSINTPNTASSTNIISGTGELESGGGGMASTTSFATSVIDADSILAIFIVSASSTTSESLNCYIEAKTND